MSFVCCGFVVVVVVVAVVVVVFGCRLFVFGFCFSFGFVSCWLLFSCFFVSLFLFVFVCLFVCLLLSVAVVAVVDDDVVIAIGSGDAVIIDNEGGDECDGDVAVVLFDGV